MSERRGHALACLIQNLKFAMWRHASIAKMYETVLLDFATMKYMNIKSMYYGPACYSEHTRYVSVIVLMWL